LEADYYCASCKTPFANAFPLDERGLCAACRAGLRGFDRAASFGFYEGALRDLIHLYKYAGMRPLGRHLARYLAELMAEENFDAVVSVPLHWRKRWRRGFNQSEILARSVSRFRATPYVDALKRVRAAEVQAGLGKTARRKNVSGAFAVKRAADVQGKRVLLIDDVMTTGATATACGLALKRAGAQSVSLLTLARVDRRWRT
jgi:ComF family protein